jgi:1,4-alpha-glucan branching enzyme
MSELILNELELHLFGEGTHERAYRKLGAHLGTDQGRAGVHFAVWAPNAAEVAVIGDFNEWNPTAHRMEEAIGHGIWSRFIPGLDRGARYKYRVVSGDGRHRVDKADPYGFGSECPPGTATVVQPLGGFEWGDQSWIAARAERHPHDQPMSVYEVHLGSWRRVPGERNRWLDYREIAEPLADYVHEMGFTHVELLPVAEHPFYGSWGYQTTGYFAPSARYGTPDGFRYLIDTLHRRGIGVILDWGVAHFPRDEHGLAYFDGTHLYEHADPRKGHHPDWDTYIFNYGRREVQSFLVSNAFYWIDEFHIDGLRVDAVASMLHLDYGRRPGEWVPNRFGGRENLEAVDFLRMLNERVYGAFPGVVMIAEESTSWPMVSRPTVDGGLGFGFKWNLGWMHDILDYMKLDPIHRRYHHDRITFSLTYAFSENFVLPFSHDEVVYGKGSLIGRMPGDEWQRFANLRLLYGYLFGHPGKKLLFMGDEFGQAKEWDHDSSLDWHLLDSPRHRELQRWVRDLNTWYRGSPALFQRDHEPPGFEWIDCDDQARSLVSFIRRGAEPDALMVVVCNFTPVPRHNYRIGVPSGGAWREVLNSDARRYGGSGQGNLGTVSTSPVSSHGRPHSLVITVPPLAMVAFAGPGPEAVE